MLTREPSSRRASTIGLLSSMRRPIAAAMRWLTLATCAASRNRALERTVLPDRSTNTRSGPLTMISVMLSSSSSGSSGPRPSMSLTSSPASWRCSRPLSCIRRSVAISASTRSTSIARRSADIDATAAGSSWTRHSARSSAIGDRAGWSAGYDDRRQRPRPARVRRGGARNRRRSCRPPPPARRTTPSGPAVSPIWGRSPPRVRNRPTSRASPTTALRKPPRTATAGSPMVAALPITFG